MSCFKSLARTVLQTGRPQTVVSILVFMGLINPGITAQEIETQRDPMASNQSSNPAGPRDDAASGIAELPKEVIFELGNSLLRQPHSASNVEFSSDGRFLFSSGGNGSDVVTRIWDVSTGKLVRRLLLRERSKEQREWVTDFVLTPDGNQLIVAFYDGELGIWNLETGVRERLTKRHEGSLHTLALSPDGNLLATAGTEGKILISKLDRLDEVLGEYQTGEPPPSDEINMSEYTARTMTFTPDGRHLVAGVAKANLIFEPRDDDQAKPEVVPVGILRSNEVVILRAEDASLVRTLANRADAHRKDLSGDEMNTVQVSPDGTRILVGRMNRVDRRDVPERIASSLGRLNIAEVQMWDFETGELIKDLRKEHYDQSFGYGTLSPDGKTIALGAFGELMLIDAETGETIRTIPVKGWGGKSPRFSPDGELVAYPNGNSIGLWNANSGERLFDEQPGHDARGNAVDYSSDGKLIATIGGNRLHVWDAQTGEHLYTRTLGPDSYLGQVEFSSDSSLIAVSGRVRDQRGWDVGTVAYWRTDGVERGALYVNGRAGAFTFSPDAKRVVVANNPDGNAHRVELWNIDWLPRRLAAFPRDPLKDMQRPVALKFSPDGRYIWIVENDGIVTRWDTSAKAADSSFVADWRPEDKRDSKENEFREPWLNSADFTADGQYLVSSSKAIYVWKLSNGDLIRKFEVP
ncbi:MAG TPA: WD40 repeat domain-containing protein, partial [Planctomycetaceae bacterium]|nr:WD40 repeat domain-containing protein [Planctomycetaceae bacterium]